MIASTQSLGHCYSELTSAQNAKILFNFLAFSLFLFFDLALTKLLFLVTAQLVLILFILIAILLTEHFFIHDYALSAERSLFTRRNIFFIAAPTS